jgi:hypothetical protein
MASPEWVFLRVSIRNEIEVSEFSNRPVDFRLNFVGHDRYIELSHTKEMDLNGRQVIEAPAEQRRNSSDYEPV